MVILYVFWYQMIFINEYKEIYMRKKIVKERQLYNRGSGRVYNLNDISRWVKYGIELGIIKRSGEKEDIEMIMKWIDMLDNSKFNVQVIWIQMFQS